MQDIKTLARNVDLQAYLYARYNNATFSAIGRTPFQAATQVGYTLSENVTKKMLWQYFVAVSYPRNALILEPRERKLSAQDIKTVLHHPPRDQQWG